MNKIAFIEEMSEVLQVAPTELTDSFVLNDSNWDSLAILSAIALIDEHFGATVNGEKLSNCTSFGELLANIDSAK